ncbi:MAG: hypothetical protein ACKVIV_06755 [Flavobacteriales bacterium]|jgi:hypothetical protein|tara:strand:- start:739 stop:987 length:249 start_codon:yes stop_codon:yes gene_type:complete
MKNLISFFLISLFFFSCSGSIDNCGEIDRKYEKNGEYFFALIMHEDNNSSDNDGGGRVYSDVTVSEKDYLSKKIGDQYCVED